MRPALVFALLAALAAAPRPARAAAAAAAVATAAALSDCLRATGAEVVEPAAGAAFAAARQVNNARISAWPIAVAYAADATQVATLVRCCAAAGVRAVPRGGGHSYEGLSVQSGAVVVDVSRIDYVEVDAQRRTARVGGGATLGKVYSAVAAASPTLAAVGGVCPSVGVGGHILGGGWGLMSRAFGQACDRVRAVALVDAAGALLEADAERNSDLLWASCGGGGGAFGVVVEFTLALVEVPPVVTLFNGTARGAGPAAAFLDAWQGWQGGADARNTTTVRARVGAATLRGLFLGGAAELKALLAAGALGASAEFEFEREAREMPWIESVATYWGVPRADLALVAPRSPDRAAFKDGSALTLGPIPREAWGEALAWAASATAALPPGGSLYFAATATGPGAVDADWPTNRTAYAHRGGLLELSYGASWPSNATAAVAADAAALARRAAAAFSRWQDAGAYLNFVDADQPAPLAAYFRDNAPRLSQIKARYDPGSLFQSAVAAIPPAA